MKSIEVRKALTDEWDRAGVQQGQQYASLTDIITHEWSGKTTRQYESFKGLKREKRRFVRFIKSVFLKQVFSG